MEYYDYICLGVCCLHIIFVFIEFIRGKILGKKIDKICNECHMPIYSDEEHECFDILKSLSKDEILLIRGFIDFLRKGDIDNA